jgi:hypothetical protein
MAPSPISVWIAKSATRTNQQRIMCSAGQRHHPVSTVRTAALGMLMCTPYILVLMHHATAGPGMNVLHVQWAGWALLSRE